MCAESALHRFDQRPAESASPRRWPTAVEAADMGASLLVVFDGLRLLRGREFAGLSVAGLLSSGCGRWSLAIKLAQFCGKQSLTPATGAWAE